LYGFAIDRHNRRDSEFHAAAARHLKDLAEAGSAWAIPRSCVHEFFAISTHPLIYDPPSAPRQANRKIEAWLASLTLSLLGGTVGYWDRLKVSLATGKVAGPLVS
jgi:predicted nucleic acid-binding protein